MSRPGSDVHLETVGQSLVHSTREDVIKENYVMTVPFSCIFPFNLPARQAAFYRLSAATLCRREKPAKENTKPSSVGKQVMITHTHTHISRKDEVAAHTHTHKNKSCCKYFVHILGFRKNKNREGEKQPRDNLESNYSSAITGCQAGRVLFIMADNTHSDWSCNWQENSLTVAVGPGQRGGEG